MSSAVSWSSKVICTTSRGASAESGGAGAYVTAKLIKANVSAPYVQRAGAACYGADKKYINSAWDEVADGSTTGAKCSGGVYHQVSVSTFDTTPPR